MHQLAVITAEMVSFEFTYIYKYKFILMPWDQTWHQRHAKSYRLQAACSSVHIYWRYRLYYTDNIFGEALFQFSLPSRCPRFRLLWASRGHAGGRGCLWSQMPRSMTHQKVLPWMWLQILSIAWHTCSEARGACARCCSSRGMDRFYGAINA